MLFRYKFLKIKFQYFDLADLHFYYQLKCKQINSYFGAFLLNIKTLIKICILKKNKKINVLKKF